MKLRLVCAALVLLASALPAHAHIGDACQTSGIAADQSLVLQSSKPEPVAPTPSVQPEAGVSKPGPTARAAASKASPPVGAPSGELLDDLMGNNLHVGGR